jgi:hypothetical protein
VRAHAVCTVNQQEGSCERVLTLLAMCLVENHALHHMGDGENPGLAIKPTYKITHHRAGKKCGCGSRFGSDFTCFIGRGAMAGLPGLFRPVILRIGVLYILGEWIPHKFIVRFHLEKFCVVRFGSSSVHTCRFEFTPAG